MSGHKARFTPKLIWKNYHIVRKCIGAEKHKGFVKNAVEKWIGMDSIALRALKRAENIGKKQENGVLNIIFAQNAEKKEFTERTILALNAE